MRTLVTTDTDFSNISWNWHCWPMCLQWYLTELFWKLTFICWCHFITDMIVYTYGEFGMNWLINKWNITHCSECCIGSLLHYITHMFNLSGVPNLSKEVVLIALNKPWQDFNDYLQYLVIVSIITLGSQVLILQFWLDSIKI